MTIQLIITAITLGLVGGLTPGPILMIALSEILSSPEKGLERGWMYILVAAGTEFLVGLFLIFSASWLEIPEAVFHILSFIGVALLAYIATLIYKTRKFNYSKQQKKVGIKHVVLLMIFNGPMWLFWLSVCLPAAFDLGSVIHNGEYLFIVVFLLKQMTLLLQ